MEPFVLAGAATAEHYAQFSTDVSEKAEAVRLQLFPDDGNFFSKRQRSHTYVLSETILVSQPNSFDQ